MTTRQTVIDTARSYLGVRFTRAGRSRNTGLDCVGLLTLVGRDLGLDIKDILDYNFEPRPNEFLNTIRSQTDPVSMRAMRAGNIVLLRQSIYPMHCGIIGRKPEGLTVINANITHRQVVEEPIGNWAKEIIELRDYKGIVR